MDETQEEMLEKLHPATKDILRFFEYRHLSPKLQAVSEMFSNLAYALVFDFELTGPEVTVSLRKLLEAKDCAVRAALG